MGIDDLVNQGKGFLDQHKDKIDEALKSEQAEGVSDGALDAASGFGRKIAPDEHDAKIDDVREQIDKHIGNQ